MKRGSFALAVSASIALALVVISAIPSGAASVSADPSPSPVMSVTLVHAQASVLPMRVSATGHVAAWQEASIGAEANGLRLVEVRVNVGDSVRRGQVLAQFHADIIQAELAEAKASLAQAEAEAREAQVNHERVRDLDKSGALSAQEVQRYAVLAATAQARQEAFRAAEQRHRLRLAQTRVLAPSDGVVTMRAATVGAVVSAGDELFRIIRDGRLEWRALVSADDLSQLTPGQAAWISLPGHAPIAGELRMLSPTIDSQTLSGLAYVDLPHHAAIRAGAFVSGHIEVGQQQVLTLPQAAVLLRDGFSYVMRVGPRADVAIQKVEVGRRVGDRIEISQGLSAADPVIASGLGLLSEGDIVRVVPSHDDAGEAGEATDAVAMANDRAPSNKTGLVGGAP